MKSSKAHAKIVAKAWSDPKFKERLLKNPEVVLQEYGVEIPKGAKVQVHEENNKTHHLVIPQKPTGEMSAKELEAAAAAYMCTGTSSCG